MAECDVCGKPLPDTAYVCAADADALRRQLHTAADLAPELATTLARQTRHGDPGPRPRNSAPAEPVRLGLTADPQTDHAPGPAAGLPYNEAASIDIGTVQNTVTTWVRVIFEQRGGTYPDGLAHVLRWLAEQLDWLRYQPYAAEAFDELGHAARLVVRAVDRPTQRVDMGPCDTPTPAGPCRHRLSAWPGADRVRCGGCGTGHDVAKRREKLLAAARDRRGTATEVARWLSWLGIDCTPSIVRGLARRGRVLADGAGQYRLGDVEAVRIEVAT